MCGHVAVYSNYRIKLPSFVIENSQFQRLSEKDTTFVLSLLASIVLLQTKKMTVLLQKELCRHNSN